MIDVLCLLVRKKRAILAVALRTDKQNKRPRESAVVILPRIEGQSGAM